MKLIKAAEIVQEMVTLQPRCGLLGQLRGLKPKPIEVAGRHRYTNPLVDFSNTWIPIEKSDVVFGDKLYLGLYAFNDTGNRIYECTVDHVKPILIGEI